MNDVNIIRTYTDVDFALFPDKKEDAGIDENDMVFIKPIPTHGTVIYVLGMIEDDSDSLLCLGAPDGSDTFRVALYPPFLEFAKGWFRLIGREDKAQEIERMQRTAGGLT